MVHDRGTAGVGRLREGGSTKNGAVRLQPSPWGTADAVQERVGVQPGCYLSFCGVPRDADWTLVIPDPILRVGSALGFSHTQLGLGLVSHLGVGYTNLESQGRVVVRQGDRRRCP